MSQYRDLGEGNGKMAISYASGIPADHSQALPSFREVSAGTSIASCCLNRGKLTCSTAASSSPPRRNRVDLLLHLPPTAARAPRFSQPRCLRSPSDDRSPPLRPNFQDGHGRSSGAPGLLGGPPNQKSRSSAIPGARKCARARARGPRQLDDPVRFSWPEPHSTSDSGPSVNLRSRSHHAHCAVPRCTAGLATRLVLRAGLSGWSRPHPRLRGVHGRQAEYGCVHGKRRTPRDAWAGGLPVPAHVLSE